MRGEVVVRKKIFPEKILKQRPLKKILPRAPTNLSAALHVLYYSAALHVLYMPCMYYILGKIYTYFRLSSLYCTQCYEQKIKTRSKVYFPSVSYRLTVFELFTTQVDITHIKKYICTHKPVVLSNQIGSNWPFQACIACIKNK